MLEVTDRQIREFFHKTVPASPIINSLVGDKKCLNIQLEAEARKQIQTW